MSATVAPSPRVVALTYARSPGTVIGRLVARRTWRSAAIWAGVFGVFTYSKAVGIATLYPTEAARSAAALQYSHDAGINALLGAPQDLDTVAGVLQWNTVGIMVLLGAIWALLTATKFFRGEEDAGRWELLLCGQATAKGAAVNVLGGLFTSVGILFVLTALMFVGTGTVGNVNVGAGPALFAAGAVALGCAMFMSVGALMSQLVPARGRAAGLTAGFLGVCFLLRSLGNVTTAHWALSLTPLGWIDQLSPYTHSRPVWLLPILALIVGCSALTVGFAGRRDLGAGVFAISESARPHTKLLNRPLTIGVRLTRTSSLVWLGAILATALLYASFTDSAVGEIAGSAATQRVFQDLVHTMPATFAESYLGIAFMLLMVLMMVYVANAVGAVRSDEASGRLDNLLVRSVSRRQWLSGRAVLIVIVIGVAGLLGALGTWVGVGSQRGNISFSTLMAAGINTMVPSFFILGFAMFVFGLKPRLTVIAAYVVLGWSFIIVMLSSGINVPGWILDTSLLHHIAFAPAAPPNWANDGVISAMSVVMSVIGIAMFQRRDLQGE